MTHARGDSGFTLMELLVSLSIASLLSVMLFGGYAFASRAWNRADAAGDAAGEVYAAQSVLRRAIAGLPLDPEAVMFTGNAATFAFMANFALPGESPEPTALALGVADCDEGQCLMLEVSRPKEARQSGGMNLSTPIVRGVSGSVIAYRGKSGEWQGSWSDDKGAPALVRIDVGFAKRGAKAWPTLYLATPGAG